MKTFIMTSLVAGLASAGASAFAGDIELAAYAGPALPSYQQSFLYDPGPLPLPPGFGVQQEGVFGLDATGGVAFGGSLTWFFTKAVGLEARVDSAGVNVETQGVRFDVTVRPPSPLPSFGVSLETAGSADLGRLTPVSLNLRLRTPGPVRFSFSAGGSWLPSVSFLVTQNVALGVTGIGGAAGVVVPTLPLQAGGEIDSALGFDAGAGLQVPIGAKVSLVVDGRFFYFPKSSLTWTQAANRPLTPLEQALIEEIQRRLGPVEFSPVFFEATAGIAVRF